MDSQQARTSRKITPTSTPSKQEQVTLSVEMGLRMRESREMSGLLQVDAAKRLGYENSSKLAKIEKGQSTRIPLWVIRKAAVLYDVSCDYLFGITATMERDDVSHASLRELQAFMYAEFDKRHSQDIAILTGLRCRMETVEKLIVLGDLQAKQLQESLDFVQSLPEWQEVRGGNRLANNAERLIHTFISTSLKYKDIKKEMQAKSGTEYQMNLLLEV